MAAAKTGDVDKIFELAGVGGDGDGGGANEADELAHKWLLVAGDFGNAEADRRDETVEATCTKGFGVIHSRAVRGTVGA